MTDSRFEELERRCAKLRRVRIFRFVSIVMCLFLASLGCYYWFYYRQQPSEVQAVEIHSSASDINVSVESVEEDKNESLPMSAEISVAPQVEVTNEILFLEPRVYKSRAQLPSAELEEAKRSLNEEQHLLKRFHAKKDFANAYALAQFYFERKSYSEVILWAKEASKRNARSDLPWILYAKAKFCLGDRAEAIRSLELFLGYINSKEVQELLNFYKGQE